MPSQELAVPDVGYVVPVKIWAHECPKCERWTYTNWDLAPREVYVCDRDDCGYSWEVIEHAS